MSIISSPRMTRLASRMEACDIGDVARRTAVKTAGTLVTPLRAAVRSAPGGAQVAREVRVHDGHLNGLVMRERAGRGDVIVGVSGDSEQADLAEELEWGGLDTSPRAWVRSTVSQRGPEVIQHWSAGLTRELNRRCR